MVLLTFASANAEGNAKYRLELQITWSKATHPFEWPNGGGHMSSLIGVTHNARYVMFADGRTASSGLKLVAENGRPSILKAELVEQTRRKRIGGTFEADGLKVVPGRISAEFTATPSHSLVSFITMIAPSPDWFTGANSLSLMEGGKWIDGRQFTLWAWDAGTDNGSTYVSKNEETQPAQSTRLLATPHFLASTGLLQMGTAKLTRID